MKAAQFWSCSSRVGLSVDKWKAVRFSWNEILVSFKNAECRFVVLWNFFFMRLRSIEICYVFKLKLGLYLALFSVRANTRVALSKHFNYFLLSKFMIMTSQLLFVSPFFYKLKNAPFQDITPLFSWIASIIVPRDQKHWILEYLFQALQNCVGKCNKFLYKF